MVSFSNLIYQNLITKDNVGFFRNNLNDYSQCALIYIMEILS